MVMYSCTSVEPCMTLPMRGPWDGDTEYTYGTSKYENSTDDASDENVMPLSNDSTTNTVATCCVSKSTAKVGRGGAMVFSVFESMAVASVRMYDASSVCCSSHFTRILDAREDDVRFVGSKKFSPRIVTAPPYFSMELGCTRPMNIELYENDRNCVEMLSLPSLLMMPVGNTDSLYSEPCRPGWGSRVGTVAVSISVLAVKRMVGTTRSATSA